MKKVIFTFLSFCLMYANSNGQACTGAGASGSSVCTISGTLLLPGLEPKSDSLAPFTVNVNDNRVIQFKNFDSVANPDAGGIGQPDKYKLDSLRVTAIEGLPAGLCWATSDSRDAFANQEYGCFKISGTPTGPAGQYKIGIHIKAYPWVGFFIETQKEAGEVGLFYYIRVNDPGDTIPRPIDTTGQATHVTMYKQNYPANWPMNVLKETETGFNKLSVAPNPFSGKTFVSFNSDKETVMTERITSIIGSEVSKKELQIKNGENSLVVDRGNLPAGVYFYSLSNGKTSVTKRIVIAD